MTRTRPAAAFDALYRRHFEAAHARARWLVHSSIDADDLVSEGFAQVMAILLAGRGPTRSFRAYLLTTITHVALARQRRDARLVLVADPGEYDTEPSCAQPASFQELALEQVVDRRLAMIAFESLPSTAREVLWYTEIIGASPAAVARTLRASPNAVSARALRAREALRTAYLDAFLPDSRRRPACTPFVRDLAAWQRNALRPRRQRGIHQHLTRCPHCRDLAEGLASVNTTPDAVVFMPSFRGPTADPAAD
ncbi:RNA polymerase sigma factor [Lentzea sp. JNUCC 0626]|uniref:RNA polymerase sigma factor n=1 Tax=Lentzea sp. JNUCC 0626 TaxID=3367513 RepID=UPI00374A2356